MLSPEVPRPTKSHQDTENSTSRSKSVQCKHIHKKGGECQLRKKRDICFDSYFHKIFLPHPTLLLRHDKMIKRSAPTWWFCRINVVFCVCHSTSCSVCLHVTLWKRCKHIWSSIDFCNVNEYMKRSDWTKKKKILIGHHACERSLELPWHVGDLTWTYINRIVGFLIPIVTHHQFHQICRMFLLKNISTYEEDSSWSNSLKLK